MTDNEKNPTDNSSEVLFQKYSHDKYLSTKHSDFESVPKPSLKILRATEAKKIGQKLRKILAE